MLILEFGIFVRSSCRKERKLAVSLAAYELPLPMLFGYLGRKSDSAEGLG